jgi:hypothetical protein
MTLTDPAITLQVKEDDEVLEPYRPTCARSHTSGLISRSCCVTSVGSSRSVSPSVRFLARSRSRTTRSCICHLSQCGERADLAHALGQQVAGTATRLNKISEVGHGRPELGRNTAGGDRQTAARGRGQRGVGEPVPGRLGPQLRRRLGRLGRVTGARIANLAQAEVGSSASSRPSFGAQPGTGPHVRASSPLQARCRTDFQPVSRPCSQGELAAIATSVGPSR